MVGPGVTFRRCEYALAGGSQGLVFALVRCLSRPNRSTASRVERWERAASWKWSSDKVFSLVGADESSIRSPLSSERDGPRGNFSGRVPMSQESGPGLSATGSCRARVPAPAPRSPPGRRRGRRGGGGQCRGLVSERGRATGFGSTCLAGARKSTNHTRMTRKAHESSPAGDCVLSLHSGSIPYPMVRSSGVGSTVPPPARSRGLPGLGPAARAPREASAARCT